MTVSPRQRQTALESVEILSELLRAPDLDVPRLLAGYLDAKRQLASVFRAIADDFYGETSEWDALLDWAESFPGATLPGATRKISSLSRTHRLIFCYLWHQETRGADNDMLRLLTGDAVHTERRLRELREAGLRISATKRGTSSVYVLNRLELPWIRSERELQQFE